MEERYISIFRAEFLAKSRAQADVIADIIAINAQEDLDLDEGDDVTILEILRVVDASRKQGVSPKSASLLMILEETVEAMIRTQHKTIIDTARELDKICHMLRYGGLELYNLSNYDYGHFLKRVKAVMDG